MIVICSGEKEDFDQYGDIDLKESGTSGIEIGTNGTKTGTNKSAWRISIEHTPSVNEKTTGFFKVLGSLRENKKETAKPYIHCFAVPNKKIGVTGFEPATSSSRSQRSTKLNYTPIYAFF